MPLTFSAMRFTREQRIRAGARTARWPLMLSWVIYEGRRVGLAARVGDQVVLASSDRLAELADEAAARQDR